MRTTLTLDPDVASKLKRRVRTRKVTFKQVVNEALRAGLALEERAPEADFQVEPHSCRFKPGIDLDRLNQLLDEIDTEAAVRKLRQ